MMRWIVGGSMKFRLLVVAAAAVLVIVGALRLHGAPVDVLPEFAAPHVEVQTEAVGLSASEVESLVSLNIEELLNGTPWLDSINSTSVPGLSSVLLTFKPGTDVTKARQLVSERLTLAYALPNVSRPPVILQPLSSESRVMTVALSSRKVSPIQMSVLTRWTIRPALLAVPGVANVAIWGYRDRQLQVRVDPKKLASDKISLDQIVRTTGNAMWVSPLTYLEASTPGSGGWIETPQQRLEVRHVFPITGPTGLSKVTVEDVSKRLGKVASVVENHPPLIGDSVLKDAPGLLLVVEKFPGADARTVTSGVEKVLHRLGPGLAGISVDPGVFRPASFVQTSIDHLTLALLVGALLVLLVLAGFFYNWRAVLIAGVAILLSLVAAALVVDLTGATMNAMVLAGLLVALALVVDEAICGVENVMRRLREARAEGEEPSRMATILEGTLEMRRVALYATAIVLLPLLPVLFATGVTGSLIRPAALSYLLGVLAAMVVALTLTPALSAMLLSGGRLRAGEAPFVARLQAAYGVALERLLRRPSPAFVAAAGLLAAGAVAVPFLGRGQVPEFKDPNLVVRMDAAAGTSRQEMARIVSRLGGELLSVPGVENVAGEIGRATLGDQIVDVNSSELFVRLRSGADYHRTRSAVRAVVDGYPGFVREVATYEHQSVARAQVGPASPVTVKLFGPRFDVLQAKATEVARALDGISGVRARVEKPVEQPHIEITVDLARAQRYGLKPGDVRREAATLLAGLSVGSLFEEQKVFDVAVWTRPGSRQSLSSVQSLLIDTPGGSSVPLGAVADVRVRADRSIIRHEQVSRLVDIGVSVTGRDAGSVQREVEKRLKGMRFPLEYHAEVVGPGSNSGRNRMIGAGIAAAAIVFLLLQAAFRSWRLAGLVFLALPLALAGGVLAASVAGESVTLGSLGAFLAVLAIAARNGLTLVGRYRELQSREGVPFGPDLVVRGARERLLPILMTAVAVALFMVPLIATGVRAGQEIAQPIAVIVLGGLVTATLLNLFLIPALYLRLAPRTAAGADDV